jgi:hypothetical protein
MKTGWHNLPSARQKQSLAAAAYKTGLPEPAIEKDYWVVLTLGMVFGLPDADKIFSFKGGSSLSKGWGIIKRFSEDIDLAISREFLGFSGEISKNKINQKLRPASEGYVAGQFLADLKSQFQGIPGCEVAHDPNQPGVITISYASAFSQPSNDYLKPVVKIEAEARFIGEPWENKTVTAFIDDNFAFVVPTLRPERTFWEKIFLLHEEFAQLEKIKTEYMSRHLYDICQIYFQTGYGKAALGDRDFFNKGVELRLQFRPSSLAKADYDPRKIQIVPPEGVLQRLKRDYQAMEQVMFYDTGQHPKFEELIGQVACVQEIIRQLS